MYTAVAIERILELPAGTVARWGTAAETPEDRALRQFITAFPWLLDVADHGFAPAVRDAAVVEHAAKLIRMGATGTATTTPQADQAVDSDHSETPGPSR